MPIILSPSNAPLTTLVPDLKTRLGCLIGNVIDEDLSVTNPYTIYQAENRTWLDFPIPRVRKIDVDGIETLLVPTTDYTMDLTNGKITLVVAVTADDTIRADYDFNIFTDEDLADLLEQSAREIMTLVHRNIDVSSIPDAYKEAILKRAYTNAFKCLIEPTYNFFRVSVGGREIDKTSLVESMEKIISMNEEILEKEINSLRNFNQTNRFQ